MKNISAYKVKASNFYMLTIKGYFYWLIRHYTYNEDCVCYVFNFSSELGIRWLTILRCCVNWRRYFNLNLSRRTWCNRSLQPFGRKKRNQFFMNRCGLLHFLCFRNKLKQIILNGSFISFSFLSNLCWIHFYNYTLQTSINHLIIFYQRELAID